MGNTYTQIHIQTVFAVKYREALIAKEWRDRLFQYMSAIINAQGHKVLAIGGVENHVHILFGFRPTESLASLMLRVKRESSEWINLQKFTSKEFRWQEGYGAFSYSKWQVPIIVRYILNQEAHHAKTSFKKEFVKILKKRNIDFDERYIFEDV